jgi:tetratricopeptide (TPR) repeat protein
LLTSDSKWKEAKEEYLLAIKQNKRYAQALASLGNVCLKLEDSDGAKKYFEEAVEINPSDKNAVCGLALMLEKIGENLRAQELFERVCMMETDPNTIAGLKMRISQLRDKNKYIIGEPTST